MMEPEYPMDDEETNSESDSGSSTPFVETRPLAETVIESNGTLLEVEKPAATIPPSFTPRSYQLEMREESLKRNIIVAMDTGSGKTHIAVLRIIDELNNSPAEKIVWFLAPSVDLCIQQYKLLEKEIPAVLVKILQGSDGVEKWKSQKLWDVFLKNVRVVVSTPQVLLDAMGHGFVHLDTLSLIVFDEDLVLRAIKSFLISFKSANSLKFTVQEDICCYLRQLLLQSLQIVAAHNTVGKSPTAKIMQDFYWPRKARGELVPHILGLSASPIMKSNLHSLEKIEEILDAICITPKIHREELMRYVNMPEFCQIIYTEPPPEYDIQVYPPALRSLCKAYLKYNIREDPYILHLQAVGSPHSRGELERLLQNQKTWCYGQLKSFYMAGLVILRELGAWAADYYVTQTILKLTHRVNTSQDYFLELQNKEKYHLCKLLSDFDLSATTDLPERAGTILRTSDKVEQLIAAITRSKDEKLSGIIFVQQRATVIVLCSLLSLHPAIFPNFRIGTVIGSSVIRDKSTYLQNLIEPPVKSQGATLDQFRRGELDLVIATNVLEEGIDIPACNAVICFDEPANLKSFVQRRGRARMKKSILMLMQGRTSKNLAEWQRLEEEMKQIYADEMRVLKETTALEDLVEAHDGRRFIVERTGALLTLDNAVAHLNHFCDRLPQSGYVSNRPVFLFSDDQHARVILPLSVASPVREAHARKTWLSERNSKKDAAFEAYVSLFSAGLVNENLLPLLKNGPDDEELGALVEKRPALVDVNTCLNPWIEVANEWTRLSDGKGLRRSIVTVSGIGGEVLSEMEMLLPVDILATPDLRLYWDANLELTVRIMAIESSDPVVEDIKQGHVQTWNMLTAAYGQRFPIRQSPFVILFLDPAERKAEGQASPHQTPFSLLRPKIDLIRYQDEQHLHYIFEEWLDSKPSAADVRHPYQGFELVPTNMAHIAVSRLPQRSNFLDRPPTSTQPTFEKRFSRVLPEAKCVVGKVSYPVMQFAMLIPYMMHHLEKYMLANTLANSILANVKFNNLHPVVMAISASSAMEQTNYQRLEFLGDSLLKICTSLHLLAEYPMWHEGYLCLKKDQVVSNSRLARAATHTGLDRFIRTNHFSGRRWRPPHLEDLTELRAIESKREMSTKVLADVVEALIGAAYVDGGMSKGLLCMQVFVPEVVRHSLEARRATLFELAPINVALPPPLQPLEQLSGYSFKKKVLLVEAMTHASFNNGTASLDRLEFLGDAVLDILIVHFIYDQEVELSHVQMHHLRASFVNADFLAFMCMEWAIEQETGTVTEDQSTHSFITSMSTTSLALWKFMRHSSQHVSYLQFVSSARHVALRDGINTALRSGSHYPWALLCELQAPKFFSDIVESLLGAVYIDDGSLDACKEVIERMGILPHLRRAIRDNVHVVHPKEELGVLADAETVKYVVGVKRVSSDVREKQVYTCEVFVGEHSIVHVIEGFSLEEVKTKAAEAAVQVLKARGDSDMELNKGEILNGAQLEKKQRVR